jgi:hypothetical protein
MSDEIRMSVWPGKKRKLLGPPFPPPPEGVERHDPFAEAGERFTREVQEGLAKYPVKVEEMPFGQLLHVDPRTKYQGDVAEHYDDKREEQPRWHEEQKVIEEMLDAYPPGTKVLDAPIGTGRFADLYMRKGFILVGIDISIDMLKKAEAKLPPGNIGYRLYEGDIMEAGKEFPPKFFDVAVMVRLTRWLTPEQCSEVIRMLTEITSKEIVFTARIAEHPHARPLSLFEVPGWNMTSEPVPSDRNYHVISMRPQVWNDEQQRFE